MPAKYLKINLACTDHPKSEGTILWSEFFELNKDVSEKDILANAPYAAKCYKCGRVQTITAEQIATSIRLSQYESR